MIKSIKLGIVATVALAIVDRDARRWREERPRRR